MLMCLISFDYPFGSEVRIGELKYRNIEVHP